MLFQNLNKRILLFSMEESFSSLKELEEHSNLIIQYLI